MLGQELEKFNHLNPHSIRRVLRRVEIMIYLHSPICTIPFSDSVRFRFWESEFIERIIQTNFSTMPAHILPEWRGAFIYFQEISSLYAKCTQTTWIPKKVESSGDWSQKIRNRGNIDREWIDCMFDLFYEKVKYLDSNIDLLLSPSICLFICLLAFSPGYSASVDSSITMCGVILTSSRSIRMQ